MLLNSCQKYNFGLFLLQSTHFANYEQSREGFEKLFRKLSDSTWDDAIHLIKFIAKRGGTMDFAARKVEEEEVRHTCFFFFFILLRSFCALIRRLICGPNTSLMTAVLLVILHCHGHCRYRAKFIVIKIMA